MLQLQELFPALPRAVLEAALGEANGNTDRAALALLDAEPTSVPKVKSQVRPVMRDMDAHLATSTLELVAHLSFDVQVANHFVMLCDRRTDFEIDQSFTEELQSCLPRTLVCACRVGRLSLSNLQETPARCRPRRRDCKRK